MSPPALPLPPGYQSNTNTGVMVPGTSIPTANSTPAGGGWSQGVPGASPPSGNTPYSGTGSLVASLRAAAQAALMGQELAQDPCGPLQKACGVTAPADCIALVNCRFNQVAKYWAPRIFVGFAGVLIILLALWFMFGDQAKQTAGTVVRKGEKIAPLAA